MSHTHDVGYFVLPIRVGADDRLTQVVSPRDGEPGFQRVAFPPVDRVAVHGGAMDARQCEDFVEVRTGAVIYDQHVGNGWLGPQLTDERDE